MDETKFGENRRAILQLYQTLLSQNVALTLAMTVAFLTEVQLIGTLGWVFWVFAVPTLAYAGMRVDSIFYWNRRIQFVMTTEVQSIPDGKDSLKWLDLFYYEKQHQDEKSSIFHRWTNFRIRPRSNTMLDYLKESDES